MAEHVTTTVMLVDDHEIVRDGLKEALERTGDFQVVAEAPDGETAVTLARQHRPEVIVMDLFMPVKDGFDACREIMDFSPETRVLVLTMANEQDAVTQCIAAGAMGFLQKTHGRDTFLATIREVAAGEYRIPSDALRRVFAGMRQTAAPSPVQELDRLTAREREMLALFVRGNSYTQIAQARGIQMLTVRNAIYNVQRKLDFANKQELVVWAVQQGLLEEEQNT